MIGRLIGGRYRVIAPLGEGGMATLWRAVDEQLDREVAVKILRPQYSGDPGFAARFKQEARSAGSLAHPNIVSVYDYGTDPEDESQYIVMQLVDGEDLAGVLRQRGTLSVDDAVRVATGVASALEAAHRRGIVHRDVKPGNILITDAADVKVTDFGIARAVSETSMTVTGTTLGSVHYFSPEQARGDEVTGASDVYSLGIVLYEMLTGRRPFEGDSAAGVALKRLNEDAPPPTRYRPDLPAGLVAVVMRALERDPARRFPDAGSFAEALRAWQKQPDEVPAAAVAALPPSGEPTVYIPPRVTRPSDRAAAGPPPYRPVVSDRRQQGQPWWIWLLALLAIVLLGAIGFLAAQVFSGLGSPQSSPSPSAHVETIPPLEGKTITEARQELNALGVDLVINVGDPVTDDEVEENHVVRTDPAAGSQVSDGDTVTIIPSGGTGDVNVPPILGQDLQTARENLEAAGLHLGNVRHENSQDPENTVIATTPVVGSPVDKDSAVDVVLSLGPTPSPSPSPTPTPPPATPPPSTPTPPTPTPVPTPTASTGG
jgi:serine/threonine-protein kinase